MKFMTHGRHLKYKPLWLVVGFCMIAFVVQQTLTFSPMEVGMSLSDKSLHTIGYFCLMGWFMQIYTRTSAKVIWAIFFVSMGVVLEFLQGLGGVRHYEVFDMLANGLGVLIALAASFTRFSRILAGFEKKVLGVS